MKMMKQKPLTISIIFLLLVLVIYFSWSLQQQGKFTTKNVSINLTGDEVVISNRHRKMSMENVQVVARFYERFGGERTYPYSLTIRPGETKSLPWVTFKGIAYDAPILPGRRLDPRYLDSIYISANIGKNKWDDSFYFQSKPSPY